MNRSNVKISKEEIAAFCKRCHIRKLSLFGSILRENFRPDSDIDILVEFHPRHIPGYLGLARMEIELSKLLGGRPVDLNTPKSLSAYFRDQVLAQAEIQYAER